MSTYTVPPGCLKAHPDIISTNAANTKRRVMGSSYRNSVLNFSNSSALQFNTTLPFFINRTNSYPATEVLSIENVCFLLYPFTETSLITSVISLLPIGCHCSRPQIICNIQACLSDFLNFPLRTFMSTQIDKL